MRAPSSVGTAVMALFCRYRYSKPVRAPSSVGTDVRSFSSRSSSVKPVRAPISVGNDVMKLSYRRSSVSEDPRSPRLEGSAPARPASFPKTAVGSLTPPTVQATRRLPFWQYAAFARMFHGASACRSLDMPASCCSAVQAHGVSKKAERSAHSAETKVKPGQMLPSAHAVSE